jgi:hypothetical protein
VSEHKDKQVKPDEVEQKGVVQDVVVPIAQAGVGGLGIGAANAWVSNQFGGDQKRPPPEKDN